MPDRRFDWNDCEDLTPEMVRVWGYDEDLILLDQDEDLMLYDVRYFPVLLELAGDARCPKQEYAFNILCQFSREQVTRGGARGTAEIRAAWEALPEPPTGRPREWYQYVSRLLRYARPSGAVDKPAARRMAEDLLLGVAGRVGELSESDSPRTGWWRFTLRTSVTEHVEVCAATGEFTYIPYY